MKVKSFREYYNTINEASSDITELKHLTHLEDLIFEGKSAAAKGLDFLKSVAESLKDGNADKVSIFKKIDGSPAIIAGYSTYEGKKKFYVGTKSIFNKNPKINYSFYDIDKNHSGFVANILKECLLYLPEIIKDNAWQGDFLYDTESLKSEGSSVSFTPNTIKYVIDDPELVDKVKSKKIGIAIHTKYTGNPEDKSLKAGFKIPKIKSSKNVFAFSTEMEYIPVLLSNKEYKDIYNDITVLEDKLKEFNDDDMKIVEENSRSINAFINSKIRAGTKIDKNKIKDFMDYITASAEKIVSKYKTDKKKQDIYNKAKENINEIRGIASTLYYILDWHSRTQSIKEILIDKLNKVKRFKTFVSTSNGFKATNDEGYVAINGKNAVKLVSRLEFSANNFNNRG